MTWLLALTVVNFLIAMYADRQRRDAERAVARANERMLVVMGERVRLQQAVDRAWDAAHEFAGDPQALGVVCAYLEHCVSPLPGPLGPSDDDLQRWINEERW